MLETETREMDKLILENRVMTQVHRWYQFYECQEHNIENQLDILTEDICVKSPVNGGDEDRGYAAYRSRAAKFPPTWKNAHHIQQVDLKRLDDTILNLTIEIVSQNIGYLPDNKIMNNRLRYHTKLRDNLGFLPKFFDIRIEQLHPELSPEYSEFRDAYAYNRIKSLVYYFILLFETHLPDASLFKELFAPEIDLHLTSARCTSYEQFADWYKKTAAQIVKSHHRIDKFEFASIGNNLYKVNLEFEWAGFAAHNPEQELEARTSHEWLVSDNPQDRFAKIKAMTIKSLKPFQPKR